MNTNFVNIIKQIIDQQGEAILAEPQRLKGYVSDYAKNEPKEVRLAFGRCIEQGYYRILKETSTPAERQQMKPKIAQQMHNISKLELPLCAEAVDILEAVLYGIQPSRSVPQTSMNPIALPQAPFVQSAPMPQAMPDKRRVFPILAFAVVLIIIIVGLTHRDEISAALNGWKGFKDYDSFSKAANMDELLGVKLTEDEFAALILLGSIFSDNINLDIVSGDNLTQKYNVSTGMRSRYNYLVKRGGNNDSTIYFAYFNGDYWVVILWKEK
jgi:hypothetical protein